jgi:tetratricopeptide (TPR) repeat protein
MNWQEAKDYCATLQLGGYSGWRLPTADEINAITYIYEIEGTRFVYEDPALKGGISIMPNGLLKWTSTLNADGTVMVSTAGLGDGTVTTSVVGATWYDSVFKGPKPKSIQPQKQTKHVNSVALCTRPMEAEVLEIAKEAQVSVPVLDVQTLKDFIPLNKARLAYLAGNYQESIAQAKDALLAKSDSAPAYWAIGISYGMSGQWQLAITNLEAALKIDKNYGDAKAALKWAQEGQKAAKNGKAPKAQSPKWN